MRLVWLSTLGLFSVLPNIYAISTPRTSIAYINNCIDKRAFFGNEDGNLQPNRTDTEVDKGPEVTGDLNVPDTIDNDGVGDGQDEYIVYTGNGTTDAGWPKLTEWVSFRNMWDNNYHIMEKSCSLVYSTTDNSESELEDLRTAIDDTATRTGLDHRLIFAVVMQESGGCTRVPTSNFVIRNPGLMQSHNGAGTCNEDLVWDPCPVEMIEAMIDDGTIGASDGDGLVQCLNTFNTWDDDVSAFYRAARCYNSGAVAETENLEDGGATHCYASDIANRLMGWTDAEHTCWL